MKILKFEDGKMGIKPGPLSRLINAFLRPLGNLFSTSGLIAQPLDN